MQQIPSKQHSFYIPTIEDSFESFDISIFNRNKTKGDVFREKIEEKYFYKVKYSGGFGEAVYYDNSPFKISKLFYSNGNIESKWIEFNNGTNGKEKGIWYEYDKEGKLTKTENFDEGYAFTWDDVLNYCVTNNIEITLGYKPASGFNTSIERFYSKDFKKNIWKITYPDPTGVGTGKGFPLEVKILDGNTGKVLDTQKGGVLEPREN